MSSKVQLVLVFLASVLVIGFFQFQSPFLPEVDGYFHIKFSLMMRQKGLFLSGFPWAQFSFWKEQFSDSCFLYHLFLVPFTYFEDLATGAKLATVLMSGAVFCSFFHIVKENGCRFAVWIWLSLLLAGGDLFSWRMNVPRPQVLSVLLMLWTMHFLANRKLRPYLVFCFLYPLSYVAGFLPSCFALLVSLHAKLKGEKPEWKFPLLGLACCAAAYLFNPYFPKNLLMFWVQNFYVMGLAVQSEVNLFLGGEFYPVTTRTLLETGFPIVLGFAAAFYLALNSTRRVSGKVLILAVPTFVFILMTFISKRFVEYSVPFSFLWIGLALSELLPRRIPALWVGVVAILLGVEAFLSGRAALADFRGLKESSLKEAALFLKTVAQPGETVITCDWDDAPELFFYNHEQRYLVMMDPTFMYYWNPKIYAAWKNAVEGLESPIDTRQIFQHIFRARFGVCTHDFKKLHEIVRTSKEFRILKETPGAYVFEAIY